MKTKIKSYHYLMAVLFLSVFFIGIDGFVNIAKACGDNEHLESGNCVCNGGYSYDSAEGACTADGSETLTCGQNEHAQSGNCVCDGGYSYDSTEGLCTLDEITDNTDYSYNQDLCDQYYGGIGVYVPNANKTGCVLATADSAVTDSGDSIDESFAKSGLGSTGTTTAVGCEEGFTSVGGVCFPGRETTGLSDASITDILMNVFGWIFGIFFILAIAAFIISGIQYFLSAGDEGMAENAKNNAVHAIIGIIVGLSGFIIVKAIGTALSGTSSIF